MGRFCQRRGNRHIAGRGQKEASNNKYFFHAASYIIGLQLPRESILARHNDRARMKVEMPGIEPGSERFDPRNSTSVACRYSSSQTPRRAGKPATICWIFRAFSRITRGTLSLSRPVRHPIEGGAGGRDILRCHTVMVRLGGEGHSSVSAVVGT